MKKLDIRKINKSSDDIWKLIQISVKNKNWAILAQNINRLHAMQSYYANLLTFQEWELNILRQEEIYLNGKLARFEQEELNDLMKINGNYQTFKARIDELFKES
jgi:uncharacterized membrane protein YgaE (UPF0421/DUF939 family)